MLKGVSKKNRRHASGARLSDRARNWRRMEMVSIQKISCVIRQKLGNLPIQTGNFIAREKCAINWQSCSTLLSVWHGPNGPSLTSSYYSLWKSLNIWVTRLQTT